MEILDSEYLTFHIKSYLIHFLIACGEVLSNHVHLTDFELEPYITNIKLHLLCAAGFFWSVQRIQAKFSTTSTTKKKSTLDVYRSNSNP